MQPEVADVLIKKVGEILAPGQQVNFAFQGGEPLLAGPDFYVSFFEKVKKANIKATYLFQTNGIALTSEKCEEYLILFNTFLIINISGCQTRWFTPILQPDTIV